jgi:hypothetical protein
MVLTRDAGWVPRTSGAERYQPVRLRICLAGWRCQFSADPATVATRAVKGRVSGESFSLGEGVRIRIGFEGSLCIYRL